MTCRPSSTAKRVFVAIATVLSLTAAAVAVSDARETESTERLAKAAGAMFVPGSLTEIVTPSPPKHSLELSHGYEFFEPLAAAGGVADTDSYNISQKPFSSYEAVVDSTSGDIGPTLVVERINGTTVVQASQAVGVGFTRSLRWMNTTGADVNVETVRVTSGQCTTDCGPDDVYFIRGYETTYSIPRFNNSGTQITVLLLQNPASYPIDAIVYFWDTTGSPIGAFMPFTLAPKQLVVFNTATVAPGVGGSLTIANNGRYGDLSAKTVALEPATGFSFDSPALPRIR